MPRRSGPEGLTEDEKVPVGEHRQAAALRPDEEQLLRLIEEFRRRQRSRPDIALRPWWSPGSPEDGRLRFGFVLEYCPAGRESAELRVRDQRVTVEGPAGATEAVLDLRDGRWALDDDDAGCPELLANLLLRLADRTLNGAA